MSFNNKHTRQRGDSLVLSLFILLLMALAFVVTMRAVKTDAQTSGALGWHTRGKQASEVVLKLTLKAIADATTNAASLTPASPAWFRTGTSPAVPTLSYWTSCVGNASTASRCDMITQNGFKVYRIVQETTASATGSASPCSPFQAKYYRIFMHAVEKSGVGSQVDTEGVYRLCF
jgi:Tfp pilus assembly protein PilX